MSINYLHFLCRNSLFKSTPPWWIYFVCNNFYIHYFFSLWYKEIEPFKNQTTTKPHQRTKNQSFLFVPFHSNHSNTKPSTNKSNDRRIKKPKTQIKKKLRLVNLFINYHIQNYSTVTDLARFLGWSRSVPRWQATWYARICRGMV